jgi:hypothetical protein
MKMVAVRLRKAFKHLELVAIQTNDKDVIELLCRFSQVGQGLFCCKCIRVSLVFGGHLNRAPEGVC